MHHIRCAAADRRSLQTNRLASLRLTERCADMLISVRDEIVDAGYTVAEELHAPIAKLVECVTTPLVSTHVLHLMDYSKQGVRGSSRFPQKARSSPFS